MPRDYVRKRKDLPKVRVPSEPDWSLIVTRLIAAGYSMYGIRSFADSTLERIRSIRNGTGTPTYTTGTMLITLFRLEFPEENLPLA